MNLKIVFLNTWGGSLYPQDPHHYQAYMARLATADIIFLSEVHSFHENKPKFVYPAEPGHRIGPIFVRQYQWLAGFFDSTHIGHFTPQLRGLHDLEGHDLDIEYGIAVFVRREHLPQYTYREGFAYRSFGKFNDGLPSARAIHEVVLSLPEATVACTHFHGLWDERGKCDTPERREQADQVIAFMERTKCDEQKPCVRVLGGDFNLTSTCQSLEVLRAATVFGKHGGTNLNHQEGTTSTRTRWYNKPGKPQEADFVIVSEGTKAELFVDMAAPSDHAALVVYLTI